MHAAMPIQCKIFVAIVFEKSPLHWKGLNFEGGPDQIRTGVEAFAELCLATRPQDLF